MTIMAHCDAPDCNIVTDAVWIDEEGDTDSYVDGWHHFGYDPGKGDWCPAHFPAEVRWYGPDEVINVAGGASGMAVPSWLLEEWHAAYMRAYGPLTRDTTPTPATDPATDQEEAS